MDEKSLQLPGGDGREVSRRAGVGRGRFRRRIEPGESGIEMDGIAFGSSSVDPIGDQLDLLLSEGGVAGEAAKAMDGVPGRHAARGGFVAYGDGPGADFLVSGQSERRNAAALMAGDTAGGENAGDLTAPCQFGGHWVMRENGCGSQEPKEEKAGAVSVKIHEADQALLMTIACK